MDATALKISGSLPPRVREGVERIRDFLLVPTPSAWLDAALADLDLLLVDHAHCEHKAAGTALALIRRYPDQPALVDRLSRLAREELRHFEQVGSLIRQRGAELRHLSASRYARTLNDAVRREEPGRLGDQLIVGALIEARSCERFAALVPELERIGERSLARFYGGLLASEARHFQEYLDFAASADPEEHSGRVETLRQLEAELITQPDSMLRFHSGPPTAA